MSCSPSHVCLGFFCYKLHEPDQDIAWNKNNTAIDYMLQSWILCLCNRRTQQRVMEVSSKNTSSSSWMALQPLWALASFSVSWSILFYNRQDSLNEWSAHCKASTETLDGKWPIILLRGPLGAWGSLTCSKFTARMKQLKVPPGGLVPWIFPSLKIRRPPPGLNPRRSSWGGNVTPRLRRPLCYRLVKWIVVARPR
jgi:hypothetical protein